MRRMPAISVAGLIALLAFVAPARAAIIWDFSPLATGATQTGDFSNDSGGQNFAERVMFSGGATLAGIDIYSLGSLANVGDSVRVRIRSDAAGLPGPLLLDLATTITIEDLDGTAGLGKTRKHADFVFVLAPGSLYWIGMSGNGIELGQIGLLSADDGHMAQFLGLNFSHITVAGGGDMAFRLHGDAGDPGQVPEPATLTLMGLGLLGLARTRRRS